MTVHIYNSLTNEKEEFKPLDPKGKKVNMYTCGVTVYDHCHIGHARSLYAFDTIRRYLKYRGFEVHFIRNITDVDDKIINKARATNATAEDVAQKNIDDYYDDLKLLGINPADLEPKATENIEGMISHIEGLIEKGFAYAVDGDVYFSVRSFKEYGKLSGQSVEQMLDGVRIDSAEKKRDPLDFALWKKSKEGEPSWDSPWGPGRPGWHIECSVMSLKHLGCQTLDIHGGGRDLIFPHHENEVAQSEALTGQPFAKYWIHHGLLTINKQKMAKSLGNFVTIKDAVNRYAVDDLKLFFLSSHYASSVDFNDEKMGEIHKAWQRFDILFNKAESITGSQQLRTVEATFLKTGIDNFYRAMDDDFNTPKALAALFDLVNDINKYIDTAESEIDYCEIVGTAADQLKKILVDIFGLFVSEESNELSADDAALLAERKQARVDKDFKRSDEIRDQLHSRGIIVEDSKDGQSWRRA